MRRASAGSRAMLLTPSTKPGLEPELTPLPLGNLRPNPRAITPAAPGGPAVMAVDPGVGATAAAVAAAVTHLVSYKLRDAVTLFLNLGSQHCRAGPLLARRCRKK